jgi:hypothetical protein
MRTTSPVITIAKLSEEWIALEDRYGSTQLPAARCRHQPSQWGLNAPNGVLHFENIKCNVVCRLTL